MEQLRQEKLEIDQQLRAIQSSSVTSMSNFTVQRRSDRGYNNDGDSIRSNRGGGGNNHGGNPNAGLNSGNNNMRGRPNRGRGNNPRYHPGNNFNKAAE